ncbi:vWA domain-containing protein [Alteromonas lipolytica]|uniref:VWFA domain-containing protein n=1 Tax=Alteromonas lipolytica TaxID=1856405 RepID=A0A1E8FJ78_9ALTE|nr:VWA domain-containing protein [Alteromonas lipolytica]OFI35991.1 hypothetical protein BFC17_09950 [Alteromonas lipolytica]GGF71865.1 hypothetical protein GCM10011338_25130 [Alteromonas lipolytica]
MTLLPADFHFLRPEWFYALIPLLLAVWLVKRWRSKATGWQGVIASHLYQHLITGKQQSVSSAFVPLLALSWLLGVIALAGPTWERIPQPVYQVKTGHVLVIDMSMSMRATDIAPDRLSRAKYKAMDLVNLIDEGDMGLVAYAGDAFVISPLTEDANTLNALLPGLSPEIMPVSGSDPIQGLKTAESLLTNAGFQNGVLYWITDGVEISQMKELSDFLSETPFKVNILGVGTEDGAPIKQLNGELLKRNNGSIVIPRLNPGALRQLSRQGGGTFAQITPTDADIRQLSTMGRFDNRETEDSDNNNQGDEWREAGPYLLLLLLPLAAFAFKRGLIFALLLSVTMTLPTPPASAQQSAPSASGNEASTPEPTLPWWKKPFLNADQQGLAAYEAEQFDAATQSFADLQWKGAAQYRSGDYAAAAETFAQLDSADGYYNQGNALAKAGELDAAIDAYEKALEKRPSFAEAKENKALIEQLKEQQEQQQQNQQNQQDQNQQDQGQQDQQQSENQDGQSGDNQQNADQQDGQQNSEQNNEQSGQQQNEQNDPQQGEQESDEQQADAQEPSEQEQQQEQSAQAQPTEQAESERDKETQQRLNNLLRRVPDDPAFLLKRKMQLEAQKRQYRRPPDSNRSDW